MNVCACSVLSRVLLFVTPWTVAHQAPLSMGFSRQEYWSGLPCSPPGDFPNPGIKSLSPESPALTGRFFTTEPTGVPKPYQCSQDSSRDFFFSKPGDDFSLVSASVGTSQ